MKVDITKVVDSTSSVVTLAVGMCSGAIVSGTAYRFGIMNKLPKAVSLIGGVGLGVTIGTVVMSVTKDCLMDPVSDMVLENISPKEATYHEYPESVIEEILEKYPQFKDDEAVFDGGEPEVAEEEINGEA